MLLLPILLPLLIGILVFREGNEKMRNRLIILNILVTGLLVITLCLMPERSLELMTIQGGLKLSLVNDGLARFFMLLFVIIWAPVTVFSFPYLRHMERAQQFSGFFTMTLGILLGLAMAQNFITLYMFFEMMSLITVPLVLHDGTNASRKAGFRYLGYSVFGAGIALGGFFFLSYFLTSPDFMAGGCLNLTLAQEHSGLLFIVFFLMIGGFGAKAGMMPMQAWLPSAHPVAPAPASAVLSGVITKGGVLAIIRVTYYMFGPAFIKGSWAQEALIILALCTIFMGSMLALREQRLKRRLAYSTISQVSYVLFGILLLTPGGLTGALLQIVFHALAKDTLFLAAGAIITSTGTYRIEELSGIGKRMPVTIWCFAAAALSLIGIPPLSGFISKWSLVTSALDYGTPWVGWAGTAVLIISALLTAGYLLPIVTNGFFPGVDCAPERKEVGGQMLGPMLVFSVLSVVLGLFPGGLINWINTLIVRVF